MYNGDWHVLQFCNGTNWVAAGGGGGAISALTAAIGANSIDNVAYAQTWTWNSLAAGSGLTLSSSAAASGNVLSITATNGSFTGNGLNVNTGTSASNAIAATANGGSATALRASNSGAGYGVYATTAGGIALRGADSAAGGYGVYGSNGSSGIGGYFTSTSGYALITGTGNVGIGTVAPVMPLHVAGGAFFGGAFSDPGSAGGKGVGIGYNTGSNYGTIDAAQWGTAATVLALQSISNGNVAIGKTSASSKLDVNGGVRGSEYISNATGALGDFGASDAGFYFVSGGGIEFVSTVSAAAANSVIIKAGQLGINTAAPAYDLDVIGTAHVSGATTLSNLSTAGVVLNSAAGLLSTLAGTTTTLLHGNAAGAPTFSAVGLTTDVTGTLPVGNGGTGTTALTQGSVVFAGASGVYSQDNANFFWDATNHSLGVGTSSPNSHSNTTTLTIRNATNAELDLNYGATTEGWLGANSGGTGLYSSGILYLAATSAAVLQLTNPSSAVNFLNIQGAATGGGVFIGAVGSDTNVPLYIGTKETGSLVLQTNSTNQITISGAGALTIAGATTLSNLTSAGVVLNSAAGLLTSSAGPLAVANGGTGTATALTQGSVHFAGASGVLAQDNANFFWDATNHRLGIGTASPGVLLQISTSGDADYLYAKDTGGNLIARIGSTGGAANGGYLQLYSSNAATISLDGYSGGSSYINNGGNVGIGTASPTSGNLQITSSAAAGPNIYLQNTNAGSRRTELDFNGYYSLVNDRAQGNGTNFQIYDNASSASRLYIGNTGNVGIGTTSPGTGSAITTTGPILQVNGGATYLTPTSASGSQGLELDTNGLANGSNGIYVSAPSGWTGNIIKSNLNGVEKFRIQQDGSAWFNGNVGIGTVASYPLQVNANNGGLGAFFYQAGTGIALEGQGFGHGVQGQTIDTTGTYSGLIGFAFSGGWAGVYGNGTVAGGYFVSSNSAASAYLGHSSGWSLYGTGDTWISGTYQGSDRRLKDDIQTLDKETAIDKLLKLRPVSFKWKENTDQIKRHKGLQYGLIAQEVQPILPQIVIESQSPKPPKKQGNEPPPQKETLNQKLGKVYGIDYTALVPWLLAGVQKQQAEIDALKSANDNLRTIVLAEGRAIEELKKAEAQQTHYRVYSSRGNTLPSSH